MAKIEILVVRDPDDYTTVEVWVDGQRSTEHVEHVVDPGAGHARSEWFATQAQLEADVDLSPAFKRSVLEARAAYDDSPHMVDDRVPVHELVAEFADRPEVEVWSRYPDLTEAEDAGTDTFACEQASRAFVDLLRENGYTAWLVRGDGAKQGLVGEHFWVGYIVDRQFDEYVDWTARQFHNVPDVDGVDHMHEWPLEWGGTRIHPVITFRQITEQ